MAVQQGRAAGRGAAMTRKAAKPPAPVDGSRRAGPSVALAWGAGDVLRVEKLGD